MTFLFEAIASGVLTYVNADDLYNAIKIFEEHYEFLDQEKYHIYVRID